MLAPIVTKDMKLFTSKPIQTARIKNVRSRAQSLQDFANSNTNKQRVKITPTNQRNSQSVGNLSLPNLSRSPPKSSSMRQPLAAIAEGIEMPTSSCTASTPAVTSSLENEKQNSFKPRSIALDDLRIISDKNFVDPDKKDDDMETASSNEKTSPSAGKRFISKITSVFKSNGKKSSSIDNEDDNSPSPTSSNT